MTLVIWVNEPGWEAAIDVARAVAAPDTGIELVAVVPDDVREVATGAMSGLMGRRYRPSTALADDLAGETDELLGAAAERLNRPAQRVVRHGRVEREVVQAALDADLLVMARDGDRSRPGPHSLGRAGRFIVDHAACPVLLVWPEHGPRTSELPPPPPDRPPPDRPPPDRPH